MIQRKEWSTFARSGRITISASVNKKTKELQERSEELSRQERKYKDLQDEYGKMWVDVCGRDLNPLGLSVAVQFIDYRDSDLAEKIIRLFLPTTWETKEIASISWRRKPMFRVSHCTFLWP